MGFIEPNEHILEIYRTVKDHRWEDWRPGRAKVTGRFDINDQTDEKNRYSNTRINEG